MAEEVAVGSPGGVRPSRRRVVRPAPLRQAVVDAVVDLIISGELKPGEHLGEGELADELGVSRQPVREAFQQLAAEGWVDLRPSQGAFVHTPTAKEADDLFAVRTLLEAESARRAAAVRNEAQVERLWELWHVGSTAVVAGDLAAIVGANAELHAYIVSIADNAVLAELNRLVDRRVRWYFTPIARSRSEDSWGEHAELIRVIAEGDQVRAGEIMAAHTERTRGVKRHLPES
jgi:DNA-binding GntR family transcriptional regulator